MTFEGTKWLRKKQNIEGVDECSNAYQTCTYIGIAYDVINLAHAAVGLAKAYKGYRAYKAQEAAVRAAAEKELIVMQSKLFPQLTKRRSMRQ